MCQQTAALKYTFQRHSEPVICLKWLPDGERFVSGSEKNMFLMVKYTLRVDFIPDLKTNLHVFERWQLTEFLYRIKWIVLFWRHTSVVALSCSGFGYFFGRQDAGGHGRHYHPHHQSCGHEWNQVRWQAIFELPTPSNGRKTWWFGRRH